MVANENGSWQQKSTITTVSNLTANDELLLKFFSQDKVAQLETLLSEMPKTKPAGWFTFMSSAPEKIAFAAEDFRKALNEYKKYLLDRSGASSASSAAAPPVAPPPPPAAAPPPPPPPPAPSAPSVPSAASSSPKGDRPRVRRTQQALLAAATDELSFNVVKSPGKRGLGPKAEPESVSRQVQLMFAEGGTPLRRTTVQRSPGGTPARSRRSPRAPVTHQDVIATALKKKFSAAYSPRSPIGNRSAPGSPMTPASPYKARRTATPPSDLEQDDEGSPME